jgi:hypothetical protein
MRHRIKGLRVAGATAAMGMLISGLCPGVAGAAMSAPPPPPPIAVIPCGDTAALKARIVALNQFAETTPPVVLSKNCVYDVTTVDHDADLEGADGLPKITGNIRIDGQGSSIIRSSPARFRLFHIPSGGNLTLNDVTLASGVAVGGVGGAILDQGTLTVNNSTIEGNTATLGGGLYVAHGATAQINGGLFTANHGTDLGGAITNTGTLTVNGANITANASVNQGGGIDNNSGGNLTLTNTAITHNLAGNGGGGLASFGSGTINVTGGQLLENTTQTGAGGVYLASGTLTIAPTVNVTDNSPTDCIGSPVFIPNCVH